MIVVFDGRCLLCNRWVQFLLRHDRRGRIRYASMQGATGSALLRDAGLPTENLETLLVVDDAGRRWRHTGAILRLLHALGGPWRLAWAAWLVPAPLRDAAYRLLARNRYRVFGRADACMPPPPGTAGRFLD
ncbi:thiol-disulfide oxidoreductase DCC family protein [Xylophilus ampelinus]|uniref:Putative DCC family thiol-disulfide oxidoreductase YuxK n=1 Tax=Xylophilus ampelinus TaxID=54067 RepID=A0A318SH86_9BURK|nr:thiol-disulfide oxidoreductase DCC family protein [Xylophilus ampelinus]MCS4510690.1 thiol-disulfide oxidoreductase DCC family protein [Xylophilus ampelinus]PYE76380.1 putative DCC family thiol-disulfide oxidoreductase YuxK [Xylophilus ampelinus]